MSLLCETDPGKIVSLLYKVSAEKETTLHLWVKNVHMYMIPIFI